MFTLQDERRAEFVVRDWFRSYEFSHKLYEAQRTEANRLALCNARDELEAARKHLREVKEQRHPQLAERPQLQPA